MSKFQIKKPYGTILISSFATQSTLLKDAAIREVEEKIDSTFKDAAYGAYSLMSMNAIYCDLSIVTEYNYAFTC